MRLFIAIRLSRPLVETLKQAQRDMRHQGAEGNFSREENLHLTLAFLGETEDAAGALSAMEEVSGGGAIRLAVSGVGRFGDLWWAGVEENLRLKTAAENLLILRTRLSWNMLPSQKHSKVPLFWMKSLPYLFQEAAPCQRFRIKRRIPSRVSSTR